MQVGLRSDNIMIPHPDSAQYRPTYPHASTSTPAEQWTAPSTRSATTATSTISSTATLVNPIPTSVGIPAPREPATSARGAPSVFRHQSTGTYHHHPPHSNPISFDPPAATAPAPPPLTHSHSTSSPSSRPRTRWEEDPPIQLRNLDQVLELTREDYHPAHAGSRARRTTADNRRYEISSMPVGDVIQMVAALLSKITSTNDRQHEHLRRMIPAPTPDGSGSNTTANSVLAFHGRNVPSITILSYLSRIHKYCPTTYEVFLSLLVYFDRMTDRVNKNASGPTAGSGSVSREESPAVVSPPPVHPESSAEESPGHIFVVDSFNIHRLVIAGVTCASKFFSDVFYTNSRYAKVGGLPLQELNHLELQFLILNDFRLSVPVEELEAYGTMLVHFYAREVIANADLRQNLPPPLPPSDEAAPA